MKRIGILLLAASLCGCATSRHSVNVEALSPDTVYTLMGICGNPQVGDLVIMTGGEVGDRFTVTAVLERPGQSPIRETGHVRLREHGARLECTALRGAWELPGRLELDSIKGMGPPGYFTVVEVRTRGRVAGQQGTEGDAPGRTP